MIPGPGGAAAAVRRARSTAARPPCWRSSHAARTCRSRWRSRCCWPTSRASCWAARRTPARRHRAREPRSRSRSPTGAVGVRVERPDGSVDELVAPTAGARTRHVRPHRPARRLLRHRDPRIRRDAPSRAVARLAGRRRRPGSASRRGASPGASPTFRPADPAPRSGSRSTSSTSTSRRIAPGDPAKLTALGQPAASPGPGRAVTPGARGPAERPNARDELWIPIVLIALLVLTLEWLVYERDTLARLRRARRRAARGAARDGRSA